MEAVHDSHILHPMEAVDSQAFHPMEAVTYNQALYPVEAVNVIRPCIIPMCFVQNTLNYPVSSYSPVLNTPGASEAGKGALTPVGTSITTSIARPLTGRNTQDC